MTRRNPDPAKLANVASLAPSSSLTGELPLPGGELCPEPQKRPQRDVSVLGLDASLTKTGWALIDAGRAVTGQLKPPGWMAEQPHDDGLHLRAGWLATEILGRAGPPGSVLILVEHPLLAGIRGRDSAIIKLVAAWAILTLRLSDAGHDWVDVTPGQLKLYATGKGNSSKAQVMIAVARRYRDVDIGSEDEADALTLAAMGAHYLGSPLCSVPAHNAEALAKLAWPAALEES